MLLCTKGNLSSQDKLAKINNNKEKTPKIQEFFTTKCPECRTECSTAASMLEHLASHCTPAVNYYNTPGWGNGIQPNHGMIMTPNTSPNNSRNAALFLPVAVPVCNISDLLAPPASNALGNNEEDPSDGELSSDSDRMDIDESVANNSDEATSSGTHEPMDLRKESQQDKPSKIEDEQEIFDPINLCMVTMENEKETKSQDKTQNTEEKSSPEFIAALGLQPVEASTKPTAVVNQTPKPILHDYSTQNKKVSLATGRRKHECFYCRKEFSGSTALKRHILLHTGEKPFKCDYCNCAYTRKFMLEKHQKVWHDETTAQYIQQSICPYCKKEIKDLNQLKTHMTNHVNEGSHRCKLCNMAFRYHAMLKEHMSKVHLCSETTEPSLALTAEITPEAEEMEDKPKAVPVKVVERKFCCDLCGAAFHRRQHLQKHVETTVHIMRDKSSDSGPNRVLVTPKREDQVPVKVPVFADVKTSKKDFECETCGAEFMYRAQYVFHLLNHEK